MKMANERLLQEITEHKRTEELLRQSEMKYRTLVTHIPDITWTTDREGNTVFISPVVGDLYGYTPEEIYSDHGLWLGRVHPEDIERVIKAFQALFTENKKFDIEYRIQRKNGVWIWLHDRSIHTYEKDGKRYADGVFSDITERKQAVENIRKLNEDLKRRTIELEAANKELETYSYSVSHDLRAPLRAMDGFSRVLLEDYYEKLDEEGKRVLNIIRANTNKMGRLIDELLSFSRLGGQKIRMSEIEMVELTKAAFEELKSIAQERKVQFNVKGLLTAHGDQAMIRQVLANFLSNAIKFTRPKEVAMIEVGSFSEKNENVYYVKDNGVGFDMQYVSKLFQVFQRLHGAEEFEGPGVGLAVVQHIIYRHGGRVWAEGKVNGGATFYFTLPRQEK
jgi:PAS domain S-box-containing protein